MARRPYITNSVLRGLRLAIQEPEIVVSWRADSLESAEEYEPGMLADLRCAESWVVKMHEYREGQSYERAKKRDEDQKANGPNDIEPPVPSYQNGDEA